MSSGVDLAEHLSLLRRRRNLFLACLLTGLLGGLALLCLIPPAYTATTQVLVASTGVQEQPNQVTGRQREALNLDTEAQVAQSAVVAAKAAVVLKATPSPAEVTVPPNSAVLSIAVTADTPAIAAAQSRAYAQAYLQHRTETAQAALSAQLKALTTKLKQVNTGLSKVVAELALLRRGSAEHTVATQRQNLLTRQVYSLTMKYDSLKTVAVTPGYVISQAAEPAAPSSPSVPLYLGSGVMLGLLCGAAAAYACDRLDTRVRTAGDVERLTGLPLLADLSGPADPRTLHELATAVVASCRGPRLLLWQVPPAIGSAPLAQRLSMAARVTVLTGADVADVARADGALLVIGLGAVRAGDVTLAVRRLERHRVPVIGAVTVTAPGPSPAAPVAGKAVPGKAALDKAAPGRAVPGKAVPAKAATSIPTPIVPAPARRAARVSPVTGDILAMGATGPRQRTEGPETSPMPQVSDT
ncbi:Wzz/FepE/Etk N-terminal domain-containing protein [Nonomuraea sp. NPDC004354]